MHCACSSFILLTSLILKRLLFCLHLQTGLQTGLCAARFHTTMTGVALPARDNFLKHCSTKLQADTNHVDAAFELFDEDCTVPFIARYREFQVRTLTVEKIFQAKRLYDDFQKIDKQRNARMNKLEASTGKPIATDLRKMMESCVTMDSLDETWAPYKENPKESNITRLKSIPGLTELTTCLLAAEKNDKHVLKLAEAVDCSESDFTGMVFDD